LFSAPSQAPHKFNVFTSEFERFVENVSIPLEAGLETSAAIRDVASISHPAPGIQLLRLGTPSLAMFRAEKRIRLRERSACSHGIVTIDSPDKPFQPIPGGDAIIVRECDQVAVRSLNPFVARPTDTATVQIL